MRWSHFCAWIGDCIDVYNWRFFVQTLFWAAALASFVAATLLYYHVWSANRCRLKLKVIEQSPQFTNEPKSSHFNQNACGKQGSRSRVHLWRTLLIVHFAVLCGTCLAAIGCTITAAWAMSCVWRNATLRDEFAGKPCGWQAVERWFGSKQPWLWPMARALNLADDKKTPFECSDASCRFLWTGLYAAHRDSQPPVNEIIVVV